MAYWSFFPGSDARLSLKERCGLTDAPQLVYGNLWAFEDGRIGRQRLRVTNATFELLQRLAE